MSILLISVGPTLYIRGRVADVAEGSAATFTFQVFGAVGTVRISLRSSTLPESEWSFVDNGNNTATVSASSADILGTFTFQLLVVDATGAAVRGRYQLEVFEQTVSVTPLALTGDYPDATYGEVYSETLTRTGGTSPYAPSVVSGSLPAGLALSMDGSNNVLLSGTADDTFRLVGDFPDGAENTYYDHAMSVVYSLAVTPPLTFSITSGALPPGLMLDPVTGRVSGEPGIGSPAAGIGSPNSFTFTLTATDSASPSLTASSVQTLTIEVPP